MTTILSFHPCLDADVNVILGSRRLNKGDLDLIRQADAVIMPQGRPEEIYMAARNAGVRMFPNYDVRFKYPGKIGHSRLFEALACRHPQTLCWATVREFRQACGSAVAHGWPFLIKDDKSHEAEGVFFVADRGSFARAVDYLQKREQSGWPGFVSQTYIPSEGNVLRAVIIGKKILTYWKRPKAPGQIITTIGRGALIDHQWRPGLQKKGRAAARWLAAMTGIDLAAVDLIFPLSEKDPDPFFLEINYYFGRRGLGGSEGYYQFLYHAVREWLAEEGLDPDAVTLA